MDSYFDLTSIELLIKWVEKYNEVGSQSPEKFLKEFVCIQKLFIERNAEQEIFKNICYYNKLLCAIAVETGLAPQPTMLVHLFLLIFFITRSTTSLILRSMRCHLTKTEMKDLFSIFQNTNLKVILSKFEIAEEFLNHDHDCILKSLKERQMEIQNIKMKFNESSSSASVLAHKVSKHGSINMKKKRTKKICTPKIDVNELSLSVLLQDKQIVAKKNTASILRTGAQVSSRMKLNDIIINNLVGGACDPSAINKHLDIEIEKQHQEEIQEMERKHLIGLISMEQAKLSKNDAIKRNHRKALQVKKEKHKLIEVIKKQNEHKMITSKYIVRKTHIGYLMTKRSQFDATMKKKLNADQLKQLKEKLKRQILEVKQREFIRKSELIHKMRFLEGEKSQGSLKKPIESCRAMSVLELKQSTTNLQQQLMKEKMERQKRIQEEHERQKCLLTDTVLLIEKQHMKHQQPVVKTVKKDIKCTPELEKLKAVLMEKRKQVANLRVKS